MTKCPLVDRRMDGDKRLEGTGLAVVTKDAGMGFTGAAAPRLMRVVERAQPSRVERDAENLRVVRARPEPKA